MFKLIKQLTKSKHSNFNFTRTSSIDHHQIKEVEDNLFSNKRQDAPFKKTNFKQIKKTTDDGLQKYKKLNLNDPLLSSLLLSVKSRKRRSQKHEILVEGRRLIIDAVEAGLKLETLLFSDREEFNSIENRLVGESDIYKVPYSDLKMWSGLTTCPGLMGIFSRDLTRLNINEKDSIPLTVICDNIREPNNLGSIIRSCAGASCSQVIITKGCCDPWDTKSLRGGCGGQFRVPIIGPIQWSAIRDLLPENYRIFTAENNVEKSGNILPYYQQNFKNLEHTVLIVGGETGFSADASE